MHRPFLNRLLLALTAALGGIAQAQAHSPGASTMAVQGTETAKATVPARWEPWWGGHVRLETDGELSCYSKNGKECVWNRSITDANAPGTPAAEPLVCGAAHERSSWKVNGYNDAAADHWCRSAYATLYAKWQDYTSLGHPYLLSETPEGDTMCYSTDGKTCTPAKDARPDRKTEVHPLVCGKHLKFLGRGTGYEPGDVDAWCRSPRIVLQVRDVKLDQLTCKEKPNCPYSWNAAVPPWSPDDHPAVIVRGSRARGQEFALEGRIVSQQRGNTEAWLRVSDRLLPPLQGDGDWQSPYPQSGAFAAGLKVSAKGQLCYFGGAWPTDQALNKLFTRPYWYGTSNRDAFIANVWPDRVLGGPDEEKFRGVSVLTPWEGTQVDEFMVVAARKIPLGGDKFRRLPYGVNCDE